MAATVGSNLVSTTAGIPKNLSAYFDLVRGFDPEVVISDFDSWTYLYGKAHARPGRKMGHINCLAATPEQALETALAAREALTSRR